MQKKLRNLLNKFTGKIYLITKFPSTGSNFQQNYFNVFLNLLPKILIICDDEDLPWMNKFVKNKINFK